MIQPPTPPQHATEYLHELAQYYCDLIDYHEQAVIAAAKQLAHVEALLGNDPALATQKVRSCGASAIASWLEDESPQPISLSIAQENTQEKNSSSTVGSFDTHSQTHQENESIIHSSVDDKAIDDNNDEQVYAKEISLPTVEQCETAQSEVLPTIKVAELLSINREQIYELKNLYSDNFIIGIDYFKNNKGHYFWLISGVEKLKTYQTNFEKKTSDIPILPEYQGLSRVEAIKKLFSSQSLRDWTITEVVQGLYGNVDEKEARYIRDPISRTLAAGHHKNYWKKVLKKLGVYRSNPS
ncbi:hypothetical protein [Crocosphaera sp. XPORK-15E]|uniref:hypothetical protein n=1 Tax=Crocosphaera sp. XPORK-15E TaxID=3110247 RepID=UPI002B20C5DD|nr:hypothetical protein [Crocosphaera sp. XPORK-15E]MEA5536805.1 hypothetical protein [Crocosphaera sp. XPORK-15E]